MNRQSSWKAVHRAFLTAVYRLTEMADTNGVEPARVLGMLSLGEDEADAILDFLVRAEVIVWPAKGQVLMTELGVRMAEQMGADGRWSVRETRAGSHHGHTGAGDDSSNPRDGAALVDRRRGVAAGVMTNGKEAG